MRLFVLIPAVLFILYYGAIAQDTSCGIIWYPPIQISDGAYGAILPQIALSGGDTLHVVWERATQGSTIRLPYTRSTDGGLTFEPVRELIEDSITYPFSTGWNYIKALGDEIFVFSVGSNANRTPIHMIRSHDAGSSWDSVKNFADSVGLISSVATYGDTIAIIYSSPQHDRRLIRSTDSGFTWSPINESLEPSTKATLTSGAVHIIYTDFINNAIETIYRLSNDLGETWDQTMVISDTDGYDSEVPIIGSSSDIKDTPIVVAAWRDAKYGCWGILGCSIASRTGIVTGDSIVWKQEEILTDYPRGYPRDIAVKGMTSIVAWEDELVANKIFHPVTRMSKDLKLGAWCPAFDHNPLDTNEVISIQVAISNNAIHVVWDQQISRTSTARVFYQRGEIIPTSIHNTTASVPKKIELGQNYPNPFNPTTTIKYQVPSAGYVTIKLYDVFGRELGTLINERKQPGEYEVEWNAAGLASGVYFYRILASSFSQTKKALLLK